jgi:hypothetical protein
LDARKSRETQLFVELDVQDHLPAWMFVVRLKAMAQL